MRLLGLDNTIRTFESDSGQTMGEYAIALGLIVMVTVAVFTSLSSSVANLLESVAGLLP